MNKTIASAGNIVFVFAFFALALIAVPVAHAADITDYGDSYSSPIDYGSSYSSPIDYGSSYSSPIDYGSSYSSPIDYGSSYSSPIDYGSSYSTPSYSTGGYTTGGYSTGGYSTGGYSTGGGYMTGGGYGYSTPVASNTYAPSYNNGNTSTYAPTTVNTNTCTGNSCNSDNHSVVNIQNPAPVINNNNVVANYAQPVATSYSTLQSKFRQHLLC